MGTEKVFTVEGAEIRDPEKYVAARQGQRPGGWYAHQAPVAHASEPVLFKEDGTPIRNPSAYVAKIEKRGYDEPLFNVKGEEIKNPAAYVQKMERRAMKPVSQKSGELSYYRPLGRSAKSKGADKTLGGKLRSKLGSSLKSQRASADGKKNNAKPTRAAEAK